MRLESALYASREGLNANGQALGVVGDNIANANTVAFKAARAEFSDIFSPGSEGNRHDMPSSTSGGGAGVEVQTVRNLHGAGVVEFTGRNLDVAITGEGWFMVGDPADPLYTRAGNFQVNGDGILTTADGKAVLGFPVTAETPAEGEEGASGTPAEIDLSSVDITGNPTSTITFGANLDATSAIVTPPAAAVTFEEIGRTASWTTPISVVDSLGASHPVTLAFFKTAANTWTARAYMDGGEIGGTAGAPVQVGQDLTLNFTGGGIIEEGNQAAAVITATPAYGNGAEAGNFTINLGSFTQFASTSQPISIVQDGNAAGNVIDFQFRSDGTIAAVLSTGESVAVAQLALRDFQNLDGLTRIGSNYYRAESDAGEGDPGTPGANGLGEIEGGALERSTVDIATQFIDLILYQRGYQASSQTFGVASTMIRETLTLLR